MAAHAVAHQLALGLVALLRPVPAAQAVGVLLVLAGFQVDQLVLGRVYFVLYFVAALLGLALGLGLGLTGLFLGQQEPVILEPDAFLVHLLECGLLEL